MDSDTLCMDEPQTVAGKTFSVYRTSTILILESDGD